MADNETLQEWAKRATKALDVSASLALTDLCKCYGVKRGAMALAAMKFGLIVLHSSQDTILAQQIREGVEPKRKAAQVDDTEPAF